MKPQNLKFSCSAEPQNTTNRQWQSAEDLLQSGRAPLDGVLLRQLLRSERKEAIRRERAVGTSPLMKTFGNIGREVSHGGATKRGWRLLGMNRADALRFIILRRCTDASCNRGWRILPPQCTRLI